MRDGKRRSRLQEAASLKMASHWPPGKDSFVESPAVWSPALSAWDRASVSNHGCVCGLSSRKEQDANTELFNAIAIPKEKAIFYCGFPLLRRRWLPKNSAFSPSRSKFLDSKIYPAFRLTGQKCGPIIDLFWQPSRSRRRCTPDGRGTGGATHSVHHRADAVPLVRKVAILPLRPDDFLRVPEGVSNTA